MKPQNIAELKKSRIQFALIFGVTLIMVFVTILCTVTVGKEGVITLNNRHTTYADIFEKQAGYNFKINKLVGHLNKMKNKNRTYYEYKHYQSLITDIRKEIEADLSENAGLDAIDAHKIYEEILTQIKSIQLVFDEYEKKEEIYEADKELYEKCAEKFLEQQKK